MFGDKILSHIKEAMPELQELQISVGGHKLDVKFYEQLNAFLVHNNVLDDTEKSIAIFHPKNDLLDIFLLIIMGLSAYKESVLKNSKLLLNDFKPGELVEYNGRIVIYNGVFVDPTDKLEKFQVTYGDKYVFSPTTESAPLKYFSEVSKYTGSKTVPDLSSTKKHKKNVMDALQSILRLRDQQVGFSGYSTFLVSSERSRLIDLLKEASINGTPFFDIFPSAKCTSGSRQRLGRDSIQRSFMFYFVSGLSTADDVLRDESSIRTLFVDARGRTFKDGTLLASIRNQYELEDIYMLQTYDRMDSIDKLDHGLGFKIWIWDKDDFSGMVSQEASKSKETTTEEIDFAGIVNEHNSTSSRLASYVDVPVEIAYPPDLEPGSHDLIQDYIRKLFSLSNDYGNTDMQNFSIHAAGVVNRIFQTPIPINDADTSMEAAGRRTFNEDLMFLKDRIKSLSYGPIPDDFKNYASEILSYLEKSGNAFRDYYGKCDEIVSIILNNPDREICILVNSKYTFMSQPLLKKVLRELNARAHNKHIENITVADNITQATTGNDVIIWTYKPPLREYAMLEPSVGKNFILLYPLQKKEFDKTTVINSRRFQPYLQANYRADVLKIPVEMLQDKIRPTMGDTVNDDSFDLEQLLSTTLAKATQYYSDGNRTDLVTARMVLFSDGTHALYQQGHKIKVIDMEQETVETKTVGTLSESDEIAFLKDSKRTVFEELVEYYQHKPEIVELIKMSELWRSALIEYKDRHFLHPVKIKRLLDDAGLVRHPATIESWLDGTTICPTENDYEPVDIIARVTDSTLLKENVDRVKDAARKIHALRIKIGRYLSKRITQSYISPNSIIDDPVLRDKLDEISSHVRIARVYKISDETVNVPTDMTNKLLTEEDIY
ncbi:hypothetical protein A2875_04235 [Candidatus Gottesmanbacteria bacterium RIFCSPHIGHO2_01_FULL_46_14]|uniref:DISARM protein DrmE C-terminal domain-containing protein n=1 Tax=Candidatus Gottesmanbacteria bacterium RIFCSPHIGHO2_01_FULL_46_14 TaxID=1798380 RepID=A0A1F5ZSZ6_9BACT|nr:MAG: hypothetical protein A2875_04235 [Candidatus Gottesmanbacteria bacterium RIFCSPHIGHO2_01_FULL_46_14]